MNQISPPQKNYWIVVFLVICPLAVLLLLLSILLFETASGTALVSKKGLRIQAPFYGRFISRDQIIFEELRILDLTRTDIGIKRRTNGLGIPGMLCGWVELSDGSRALTFITNPTQVLSISSLEGYSVFLSTPEPSKLISALNNNGEMEASFPISSPPSKFWLAFGGLIGFLLIMVAFFLKLFLGSSKISFEAEPMGLRIRAPFYGRFIPWEYINAEGIRIVDLSQDGNLKPELRTNGTSLPGFKGGWFKLANGIKALIFITVSNAIYIPVNNGEYAVLISPFDTNAFYSEVKKAICR